MTKSSIRWDLININSLVATYDVWQSLLWTSSGPTYGQLLHDDMEAAEKKLSRVIDDRKPERALVVTIKSISKCLKLVIVTIEGAKVQSLLDSGAVPSLLSTSLAQKLEIKT